MADGSLGVQIKDNLMELGKATAKAGVQAVSDIASGTMETMVRGVVPSGVMPEKLQANKAGGQDPTVIKKQESEVVRRRQLAYVRQQLEAFQQRKGQQKAQEQQVKQVEKQKEDVKKAKKKREDESLLSRLTRTYGGSHEGGDSKAMG